MEATAENPVSILLPLGFFSLWQKTDVFTDVRMFPGFARTDCVGLMYVSVPRYFPVSVRGQTEVAWESDLYSTRVHRWSLTILEV